MVECPECRSEMRHYYTDEEIENLIKDADNPIVKANMELALRREFICDNCKHIKKLSTFEVIKEFARIKTSGGSTPTEIIDEVKKKAKDIEKELKGEDG